MLTVLLHPQDIPLWSVEHKCPERQISQPQELHAPWIWQVGPQQFDPHLLDLSMAFDGTLTSAAQFSSDFLTLKHFG